MIFGTRIFGERTLDQPSCPSGVGLGRRQDLLFCFTPSGLEIATIIENDEIPLVEGDNK
jgi:hypothetical protein